MSNVLRRSTQVFLSMDWLGAFFSLMALGKSAPGSRLSLLALTQTTVAQHTFDYLGGILYILWYEELSALCRIPLTLQQLWSRGRYLCLAHRLAGAHEKAPQGCCSKRQDVR